MGKDNLVANLSLDFAIRIVNLYKFLCTQKKEYVLSNQVLRSGTSIGANLAESEMSQSAPDFIAKLHIALKEANETKYWLTLLQKTNYITKEQFDSINKDLRVIIGLLVNGLKKIKERYYCVQFYEESFIGLSDHWCFLPEYC